jgi:hypothetical protein
MTCRTAWAGEQLHDVEAGPGGDRVSRARRGSVAASPESTRISVQLRGIASTAAIAVSSPRPVRVLLQALA